ncbi:Fis family sigma54 specific transcriptional regulator [Clostridium sporogenes]|uniref:sigma-54-dependent Fis family transcriptional regulator n=1 Tax=Clostridium botulinum TaxID=1491 RepID=UPI0007178EA6|nr:sigma 54-interacting transcriptional regulator [Clostridium botulinum]KRU26592.1 Fis family sigma54 specific transcriptional regulator [Clostridium sporogenes]KRU28187.1 Fis family sigma54 specific transcriptional regulator [Clostridium sporogenes]KRU29103.1 Fis family sigma54 specific transcriptional regulator [Clostridium sporogenes]KRU39892.1 Fis family sigma54 specific transcriptional regulator [Clostridium sporogenes]MBZ1329590.1 sigma 54-interacting transcriptional regulator [Clostrid
MKSSTLLEIQDTVAKYANIISNIIKVDVEIVDKNLCRVAGTGIYKNEINKDISKEGYVYAQVIKTGDKQIIKNPGQHYLCKKCNHRDNCVEKMLVCTPIILNEDIIGVIGLVCSEEGQRNYFIKNFDSYIQILDQISDFISTKSYEHIEIERSHMMVDLLNQIIDSVDKGVLVTKNNEIVHMNTSAMKQLKLKANNTNKKITISSTSEYIMGGEVYTIVIDNEKFQLMGRIIPVFPVLSDYDTIFVFEEIKHLKSKISKVSGGREVIKVEDIIGQSQAMVQLKNRIKKIASSSSTVLITGESGTGKEVIARAIHCESDKNTNPFIAINCGAIPDALLESELFGYVRGAFSGADPNGRVGKFELANNGIIFLDEIGDMPLYLQVKILRVLQERKLVRIGSNHLIDLDIRVIAATNKDLKKLIKENKFREDLYYRLNVIPLKIPPLRERKEDIELLMEMLIKKYNGLFGKIVHKIDKECKDILIDYPWYGNVRELENAVEFMINMADDSGIVTMDMLPANIVENKNFQGHGMNIDEDIRPLKDVEKDYILRALDIYGHDTKGKRLAAERLGIGIATLYRKLEGIKNLSK